MADTPLRVGMLGYRFMGDAHTNALQRLPQFFPESPAVELDVLIGRDEDSVADAADRFGFNRTSTDWEAVIDDVDVFYNLGPNWIHAEPSIAALENDVAVLCEKPLAESLESAREMVDAAEAASVPAGCAFNYRFIPAIQYARQLIADGAIGEIREVRGRYLQDWLADEESPWTWRMDADQAGSGSLGDLGAHTIDLFQFLIRDAAGPITEVSGQLQTFVEERSPADATDETRPVTVDDAYTAAVQFDNGAIGTLEASRVCRGHKNDHGVEIHGSEGSVKFGLERLNELEVLTGDARGYETVLVTDESDPFVEHWWPPGHMLGWEHTFVHENATFLDAVVEGGEFSPTFEEAYYVQQVLGAIQESAETGERVSPADVS